MRRLRVIIPVVCVLVLFGCQSQHDQSSSDTAASTRPSRTIQVVVDPRIELLSAVQQFNEFYQQIGLITRQDFPYKHEMREYFQPYADHEAVRLFNIMADSGFNFDAPPTAILHLSSPPELAEVIPFDDYVLRRAHGRERLEEFVAALRDFARMSHFAEFWKARQSFYDSVVATPTAEIANEDYAGILEQYYGVEQHSYAIIDAPILHDGGYGPRIAYPDGGYDVYQISGPNGVDGGLPVFGSGATLRHIIMHEFSHSFVNPLTDQYGALVDSVAFLFEPIAEMMQKKAYGNWRTCVNEHIVRAFTTRMAYRFDGQEAGDRVLQQEKDGGFVYIAPLVNALERYEANRSRYPTLGDFYPELMKTMAGLTPSADPL